MAYPIYGTPGILPSQGQAGGLEGLLSGGNPLLNIGLGILANNSGNYGNAGVAIGRGAQQGMQQSQQYKQFMAQNALANLQLQKAQQEMEQKKKREAALPRLLAGNESYTSMQETPVTTSQNMPIPAAEGAQAPNFGLQRQDVTTMQQSPVFDQKQYMQDLVDSGYGDDIIRSKLTPREANYDIAPDGTMYDKKSGMTIDGRRFAKPEDSKPINGYLIPDGKGGWQIDQTLYNAEKGLKRAGASSTNVSVSTDKGYAGEIVKGLATQDLAAIDAGRAAPQRLENARNIKQILASNPITGTGAESRLAFEKTLATAGIIDGNRVKNTEDLVSLLASGTLDSIKTSGLGSGQGFTDKDRQFLEKAKSGNIEINAGTLGTLAELNEKAALASINRGNQVIEKLKTNPDMGKAGYGLEPIPVPEASLPQVNAKPLPAKPSAMNLKKGEVYQTGKGALRWNGKAFEDL
jgi:hypothetical protein